MNVGPDQRADVQRPHKAYGTNHPDQLTHNGEDHGKEDNKHERANEAQYGPAKKRKGLRRHKSNGLPGPHGHRDTEPGGIKDHL